MNESESMPSDDLTPDDMMLHALASGELDDEQRQAVFTRLDMDPALRQRYRQLVALHSAISEDARSLSAPPEAEAAVFNAIGLAVPTSVEFMAGSSATGATGKGWSKFRWLPFALLGTGILCVAWFYAIRTDGLLRSATAPAGVPRSAVPTPRQAPPAEVRQATPDHGDAQAGNADRRTSDRISPRSFRRDAFARSGAIPLPPPPDVDAVERPDDAAVTAGQKAQVSVRMPVPAPDIKTIIPEKALSPAPAAANEAPVATLVPDTSALGQRMRFPGHGARIGLVVSLRGIAAASFPSVTIPSQSGTSIRNIALGVDYTASTRDRIGFEIGRETVPQSFGRREADESVRYEQNPLEYWVAGYYDRTITDFLSPDLTMYARVGAGTVWEIGPMFRGSVGLRFPVSSTLGLFLAGEGTLVAYRFNGLWLTTKKYGVTAGISFAF
jgi:hypothetical protein